MQNFVTFVPRSISFFSRKTCSKMVEYLIVYNFRVWFYRSFVRSYHLGSYQTFRRQPLLLTTNECFCQKGLHICRWPFRIFILYSNMDKIVSFLCTWWFSRTSFNRSTLFFSWPAVFVEYFRINKVRSGLVIRSWGDFSELGG